MKIKKKFGLEGPEIRNKAMQMWHGFLNLLMAHVGNLFLFYWDASVCIDLGLILHRRDRPYTKALRGRRDLGRANNFGRTGRSAGPTAHWVSDDPVLHLARYVNDTAREGALRLHDAHIQHVICVPRSILVHARVHCIECACLILRMIFLLKLNRYKNKTRSMDDLQQILQNRHEMFQSMRMLRFGHPLLAMSAPGGSGLKAGRGKVNFLNVNGKCRVHLGTLRNSMGRQKCTFSM